MNIKNIGTTVKRSFSLGMFKIKKYSPEILLVTGIVSGGAAIITACKATLDVEEVLDKHTDMMCEVHKNESSMLHTEMDTKRETAMVYLKTGCSLAKHYWIPASLFAVSVCCLVESHSIMSKRYLGAVAAYKTLDAAYKTLNEEYSSYRNAVIADAGKEKDIEYSNGTKVMKEATLDKDISTDDTYKTIGKSAYAKLWDETTAPFTWRNDPLHNAMFLQSIERWANNVLMSRGYLFLNEVYDALELTYDGTKLMTKSGQYVGWIFKPYSKDPKDANRDNYISFGVDYDAMSNGNEPSVVLDFNVDGWIMDDLVSEGYIDLI